MTDWPKLIAAAPTPEVRHKLVSRMRMASARRNVDYATRHPWDARNSWWGDAAALRGVPDRPEPEWFTQWQERGYVVVDSRVLDELVVVVRDDDVTVPDRLESLVRYTAQELRMVRDWVRGGEFRLADFESLHWAKAALAGRVVSPAVRVYVGCVEARELTLCGDGRHRKCRGRMVVGDFVGLVREEGDHESLAVQIPACDMCALQYEATDRGRAGLRWWFGKRGPVI